MGLAIRLAPAALAAAGCHDDPAIDEEIAALGPEDPAVRVGPLHRPNQPCVRCHSPEGKAAGAAETIYSVAGTVYRDAETTQMLAPIEVHLVDSAGAKHTVKTNCAGNFYIKPEEYAPVYPMWVTLRFGEEVRDMESSVGRDGSCAACHTDPIGTRSVGHVYLAEEAGVGLPVTACSEAER